MRLTEGGELGVGTALPRGKLDVVQPGAGNALYVGNTGTYHGVISSDDGIYFNSDANNNGTADFFAWGTDRADTTGGIELMRLLDNGNLGIGTTGPTHRLEVIGDIFASSKIYASGSCVHGCDRVFQPDYELESIEEHAALMWEKSHLPAVGPTVENGVWNITEKTGGMLNEIEKAHIYTEQLNTNLQAKAAQLSELQQQNEALAARLAALEAAVAGIH